MQLHTGFGDGDLDLHRTNPLLLLPFLRTPEVARVPVLLHCYPDEREAGYLAHAVGNVYLDVGLSLYHLGARARALVVRSYEMTPAKVLYSSDAWGPADSHHLGARLWRNAVAAVPANGWTRGSGPCRAPSACSRRPRRKPSPGSTGCTPPPPDPTPYLDIDPQGSASLVGRAVPLTFAIATVAVLLIADTVARLSQRFDHSGSVHGFVGVTLGARSGAFSGWAMAGSYLFHTAVTSVASRHPPHDPAAGTRHRRARLARLPARCDRPRARLVPHHPPGEGRHLLPLHRRGGDGTLILLVTLVVLVRLLGGNAPGGRTSDLSVPAGSDVSAVFLGTSGGSSPPRGPAPDGRRRPEPLQPCKHDLDAVSA